MFGFSFSPQTTSVADAHERLGTDGHALLDVRTRDEVRALGIPGALRIPLDQLETRANELASYTSIDVICRSGGRSAQAAHILKGLGYPQATSVAGGILAWQDAGFPTA